MTTQLTSTETNERKQEAASHPVMKAKGSLLKATAEKEMPEFLEVEQGFSFEYWDIRDLLKWVDYITPKPTSLDAEDDCMIGNFDFYFFYPEGCKLSPEEFLTEKIATLTSYLNPDYYMWTRYMMHED
jgi:hypothetical protein